MHPFGPQATQDPHPIFASLRANGSTLQTTLPGGMEIWLITRYEDAKRALADPRLSKGAGSIMVGDSTPEEVQNALRRHMLNLDPPDHTRLRRLVSSVFTARRTAELGPRIEQIAAELLDTMAARAAAGEPVDLIDHYAYPLPLTVICELLGVPAADRDSFRAWTSIIVAGAAGDVNPVPAMIELNGYLRRLIAAKRAVPDEALLSGLIEATDAGDRLTEDELTSMVFLLLIAGHETTVNLIGNAMYLLLGQPDQAAALRADPELLPAAIEEFLRYESPVKTATMRRATQDVTYDGVTIPAGAVVLVALLSANRDGDAFPGADKLELHRADGPHLAFGHGIHYCLGAPLARLEARIAIGALLARFPELAPAAPLDSLPWIAGVLIRGLTAIPVRLS